MTPSAHATPTAHAPGAPRRLKVALFANTDWYLHNFRSSLAQAIRDAGHEVLLVSPPGPYAERGVAQGLNWVTVPLQRRSLNPLREAALVWHLRGLLAQQQVDLVHGFTIKCVVYGALAARLAGIPARISALTGLGHVFTGNGAKARVLRVIVSRLLRLAMAGEQARVIVQNPDDHAVVLRTRASSAERLRLIPGSGVDCARFAPAPEPAGPRLRVVLAARLLWEKGVAEYVEAARLLRAQGRDIEFVLAGTPDEGNPATVPERTVHEWVHSGLVQWLGHVTDMPGLFHSAHIVALPSYREGLPKSLIEAAACGKPIVTTDAPGCREVVTHGVDGLIVPTHDAAALAAAIAQLQDDPALRQRLGAAARERALREFDERIVISRTLGVYGEVLEGV